MKSKFDFYDVVKINSSRNILKKINGSEGVVLGKAQNEETGLWSYGVSVYKDNDLVWHVLEEDLLATGKKADPKNFEVVETIRVLVNPETGEGYLPDRE
jgi:hypothetical protein